MLAMAPDVSSPASSSGVESLVKASTGYLHHLVLYVRITQRESHQDAESGNEAGIGWIASDGVGQNCRHCVVGGEKHC